MSPWRGIESVSDSLWLGKRLCEANEAGLTLVGEGVGRLRAAGETNWLHHSGGHHWLVFRFEGALGLRRSLAWYREYVGWLMICGEAVVSCLLLPHMLATGPRRTLRSTVDLPCFS